MDGIAILSKRNFRRHVLRTEWNIFDIYVAQVFRKTSVQLYTDNRLQIHKVVYKFIKTKQIYKVVLLLLWHSFQIGATVCLRDILHCHIAATVWFRTFVERNHGD